MALKHVVLSPAPASGARLALRRLKIKSRSGKPSVALEAPDLLWTWRLIYVP